MPAPPCRATWSLLDPCIPGRPTSQVCGVPSRASPGARRVCPSLADRSACLPPGTQQALSDRPVPREAARRCWSPGAAWVAGEPNLGLAVPAHPSAPLLGVCSPPSFLPPSPAALVTMSGPGASLQSPSPRLAGAGLPSPSPSASHGQAGRPAAHQGPACTPRVTGSQASVAEEPGLLTLLPACGAAPQVVTGGDTEGQQHAEGHTPARVSLDTGA